MKKLCFIFLTALVFSAVCAQEKGYFTNPVIRTDMADPSVIRIGKTYYATGSSSEWAPYYPVYTSKDLVNWTQQGYIFDEKPEWTSTSFWAPELFYHNGKVLCYYTARRKTDNVSYIGVASAPSPTGPYTDHGVLVEWGSEAIDAFVFDDDGQLYISWKAYGLDPRPIELIASRLSEDGLRLEGEPFSLLRDDENIGMEGQYHFKEGEWYYIIYAPRSCCGPGSDYEVYVARSKNFAGPYEKFAGNPILYGDGGDFQACGHGTGVQTPDGRYFFMCHAYVPGEGFYAGRQPILQEFFVTEDGWVQFKTGSVAMARQQTPFKGTAQKPVPDFKDKFRSAKLKVDWTWNYPYSDPNIKLEKGILKLSGAMLSNSNGGTALCVRPSSPDYIFETRITNYHANKSFKGLAMYGDDRNFIAYGIQNNTLIIKTVQDGKEDTVGRFGPVSDYLRITVSDGRYLTFESSYDGKKWNELGSGIDAAFAVRWDRIARPGLIHIGEPDEPAEFKYFKLTNLQKTE